MAQDTACVAHSTKHQANRLVNRSQMAEDIAHATQHAEQAHR